MTRLPFRLPDFTRVAWAGQPIKETWEPRVQRVVAQWQQLEQLTVREQVREACITMVPPGDVPELTARLAADGLTVLPMGTCAAGQYATTVTQPSPGQDVSHRIALVRHPSAQRFLSAWQNGDDDAIGALLGFPECCRRFFSRVWKHDRRLDTTWQQAGGGENGQRKIVVESYAPEANVLGRWLGIRAVPHLPCSFTCEPTQRLAARWASVARQHGLDGLLAELGEMLSWPVEWSALHGIAIVKTPVWKVITRTDATAETLTVNVRGRGGVSAAARGAPQTPGEDATWQLNGFTSAEAMHRAHAILDALVRRWRPVPGSVLDLGCGTGALARKLATHVVGGVEMNAQAVAAAREADPAGRYVCGDLRDVGGWPKGPWALRVCMVGRLLEGGETEAVRQALRDGPALFYAYDDWLSGRAFDDLLAEAGQADRAVLHRIDEPGVVTGVVVE